MQPSKDKALIDMAANAGVKYLSSTSSISSPLIALYYIFSSFRTPQSDNIYEGLPNRPSSWMISFRKPISFYLHRVDKNVEAIVSDQGVMPPGN